MPPFHENRHGFQEQSLLLNLSVAENVYFGQEAQFARFGIVNWRRNRTGGSKAA